ncbi:MAG: murein hydrolase activator EnvC family protein [Helicobacteraceae bacterium]
MKKIFVFVFVAVFAAAVQEDLNLINKKIQLAKQDLKKHSASKDKIKNTLENLADKIYAQKDSLKKHSENQSKLEVQIRRLAIEADAKEAQMKKLQQQKQKLTEEKSFIEVELIDLMVSNLTTSIVAEKENEFSVSDMIKKEALIKIKEKYAKRISVIKNDYIVIDKTLSEVNKKIDEITELITDLTLKRQEIKKLKKQEQKELTTLAQKQTDYKKELERIIYQQEKERKLLKDLDTSLRMAKNTSNAKVKKYGSSYLSLDTKHYYGKKYRPPIDDRFAFKVVKKFGPYIDPIYNIKIHNDYIAIETQEKNPIIRSIMNGRVVYADNLQTLGNVVIVKHENNMHTIYRNLNNISPNIKVNKDIEEREAVGRVMDELVFEVTKDGVPIDPLEIIHVPSSSI